MYSQGSSSPLPIRELTPADVSAVVCTLDSIASIEECLASLRQAGVGEVIVVDGGSTDGTRGVAERDADLLLDDPRLGLGYARNVGIARTTRALILNMGSDNIMPAGQLPRMIRTLQAQGIQGVSACTSIQGDDFVTFGLNAWRRGRFVPGAADVIGTPTLFVGDMLRAHPYDADRRFSDDSELCERWRRDFGARFAIADATVVETGKASWAEVLVRCRMYGISDDEVYRSGAASGWTWHRKAQSLLHPLRADLITPAVRLPMSQAARALPFLAAFTALRYGSWARTALRRRRG